jgi:hypothetical protein
VFAFSSPQKPFGFPSAFSSLISLTSSQRGDEQWQLMKSPEPLFPLFELLIKPKCRVTSSQPIRRRLCRFFSALHKRTKSNKFLRRKTIENHLESALLFISLCFYDCALEIGNVSLIRMSFPQQELPSKSLFVISLQKNSKNLAPKRNH